MEISYYLLSLKQVLKKPKRGVYLKYSTLKIIIHVH